MNTKFKYKTHTTSFILFVDFVQESTNPVFLQLKKSRASRQRVTRGIEEGARSSVLPTPPAPTASGEQRLEMERDDASCICQVQEQLRLQTKMILACNPRLVKLCSCPGSVYLLLDGHQLKYCTNVAMLLSLHYSVQIKHSQWISNNAAGSNKMMQSLLKLTAATMTVMMRFSFCWPCCSLAAPY